MPIVANVGLQGSGKTFDAIREKVVSGVVDGRRVVTNIEGINPEAIYDYVDKKYRIPREHQGTVVSVEIARPAEPGFFPKGIHKEGPDEGRCDDADTIVKAGDLVVIDEARRFWQTGMKIPEEHAIFFAEHRHYTHPSTNVCCDLVYIIQDIKLVNRTLKNLTELTFRFKKLKSLGLTRAYVCQQWEGATLSKDLVIATYNKTYDPQIFALYKSYSGNGQGKELTIDKRQNVLLNKKLWALAAGVVISMIFAIRFIWAFFHPDEQAIRDRFGGKGPPPATATQTPSSKAMPGSQAAGGSTAAPVKAAPVPSSTWRIAGTMESGGHRKVLLVSTAGRLRYEHPSNFQFEGTRPYQGTVDGELVTWNSATIASQTPAAPSQR